MRCRKKKAGKGVVRAFKGPRWKDGDYRDLLALLYALLSTFKKGGATGIEPHLDHPEESRLFSRYPRLLADHHLVEFICDYLRMMTVNFEDPHQLADGMSYVLVNGEVVIADGTFTEAMPGKVLRRR